MENFEIDANELKAFGTLKEQLDFLDEFALDEPEHAKIVAIEKLYIEHLIETHNEYIPFGDDETHIKFSDPSELIWVHSEEIDHSKSPSIANVLNFCEESEENIYHRIYTKKIQPDAQLNIPYIYNDYYLISINNKPAIFIYGEDRESSSVFSYRILIITK